MLLLAATVSQLQLKAAGGDEWQLVGVSKSSGLLYLDLFDVVDDEHVLQVLHGSFHPVVERRRPLGVLEV